MSDQVRPIKWSSDEYKLERFVDLLPLPQVVRIKSNLKGNNDRKGQPGKMSSNNVVVVHSVRQIEVIRATDSLRNEFYLPHDSTAKVEVIWKDYKKFYDNVEELVNDFPAHVLVVEEDEFLGIKKGDILKLKKKIKIRENNYLKCTFLDANRADVNIPFSYKGLFKTLGDLTSENIPLKEAVEFCRLPRKVKFIDDQLKMKRIDGTPKCPTLLSSLEHVTLHEIIDHIDVIASQVSDGQVVVSSIPLVDEVIVNAATAESRGDPDYTRHCQTIHKETTSEMIKEIGILHESWVVFQEDGTKCPSSWNQELLRLVGLGYHDTPNVKDDSASLKTRERIPEDKEPAPSLPPKMQALSKKEKSPPIPPRIPLQPQMGQGRPNATLPPRPRAISELEDAPRSLATPTTHKSRTLPRMLNPTQHTVSGEENYAGIRFAVEPNSKDKPSASHQDEWKKHQDVDRIIKERYGTSDALEGEGGYVPMAGNVPHLQTKYDLLCESIHRQAQPDYPNVTSDQESQGRQLYPNELEVPGRERSSPDMMPETRAKIKNKDYSRLQKRRSFNPDDHSSQSQGQGQWSTFPLQGSKQSQSELMENMMPSDSTGETYLRIRFKKSIRENELYSVVPSLMVQGADRRNQLPMLKCPQEMSKPAPGLDFINRKNVRSWSSTEVLKFLKFLNLEKYTKLFKQKKIDGEMLVNLDKKGLNELHIEDKHAATITKLVHECIKHENSTVPNQYVP